MATKTDEEKGREMFKQELLNASAFKLRHIATEQAAVEVTDLKKAVAEGDEAVVELILEKWDDGWRPGGAPLNPKSQVAKKRRAAPKKDAAPKKAATEPDTAPDPEPDPEPEPAEGVNPWDEDGEDDDSSIAAALGLDDDDEEPTQPVDDQPDSPPEPERARESSAVEEKLDQILDLVTQAVEVLLEVNDNAIEARKVATQTWELSTRAFGRLFKNGAAKPLKGFATFFKTARDLGAKAVGQEVEKG